MGKYYRSLKIMRVHYHSRHLSASGINVEKIDHTDTSLRMLMQVDALLNRLTINPGSYIKTPYSSRIDCRTSKMHSKNQIAILLIYTLNTTAIETGRDDYRVADRE